jgi:uncharacterized protein (DUF2147 family)
MRFKKLFILTLFFAIPSLPVFAQNEITGKWLSEDKKGIIEIYKQAGKFDGKITWLSSPKDAHGNPMKDMENPDKSKRNQLLIGLVILKGFAYKNGEWKGGTIYDPNNGKTYSCTMWLSNEKTLKIRGYWGILYETQKWTRVQ